MRKYKEFIQRSLTEQELLEQLAEECAELSQAALKLIRAKRLSGNRTPVSAEDALNGFMEEKNDVLGVLYVLGYFSEIDMTKVVGYYKLERWAKRLGYREVGNAD